MRLLYLIAIAFPLFKPSARAESNWLDHWEKIPSTALPSLTPDGDLKAFRLALERQIVNCAEFHARKFTHCGKEGPGIELNCDDAALKELTQLSKTTKNWDEFFQAARTAFDWFRYKPAAPAASVLFTGYNSPLFQGSRTKTEKYKFPLYGYPDDLVLAKDSKGVNTTKRKMPDGSLTPFFDRKAIEIDHALAGRGLEIAWFEFPSDILRLQIEGSGVLEVTEKTGKTKQIGINYAGKNGLPYVSIFKTMKEKSVDKKYLTFPGLKQYYLDHPDDFWAALTASPSYVFFSLTDEPACGTARVHVTGDHSIAVDPTQLPLGSAAFLEAERPVEGTSPESKSVPMKPFTRFAFAQDTGGAIKGAHVDVYWGTSEYAMLASNSMQSHGKLYLLRSKAAKK